MSASTQGESRLSRWWRALKASWTVFWYKPIAAERLALVRITTALAVLTDMLVQQLPYYSILYGPEGLAPHGYSESALLRGWRLTGYFFTTTDFTVYTITYIAWAIVMVLMAFGVRTRIVTILAWLLTMAFIHRNFHSKNFGDSVVRISVFLLMFMPCGDALSWDAWKRRGRALVPTLHAPWGVRIFQIQLCAMYTATGVSKLTGGGNSTWFDGTTLFYVYNDIILTRVSYVQLPLPAWLSPPLTYIALIWELLFIPFVIWSRTRRWVLYFGIAFHLTVFLTIEVGWFGFFALSWYCAWIPDGWIRNRLYPWLWKRVPRWGRTAEGEPAMEPGQV